MAGDKKPNSIKLFVIRSDIYILLVSYGDTYIYTSFIKNILIIFKENLNMMTYITYKLWYEFFFLLVVSVGNKKD